MTFTLVSHGILSNKYGCPPSNHKPPLAHGHHRTSDENPKNERTKGTGRRSLGPEVPALLGVGPSVASNNHQRGWLRLTRRSKQMGSYNEMSWVMNAMVMRKNIHTEFHKIIYCTCRCLYISSRKAWWSIQLLPPAPSPLPPISPPPPSIFNPIPMLFSSRMS